MIEALKTAVGNIIPHANHIQAGQLGIPNLDANIKLDPVIAEDLSTHNRASGALERGQVVIFDTDQQLKRSGKDAEASQSRYFSDVERDHHTQPDPDLVAHHAREVSTSRAAIEASALALTAATARSAGTRAALAATIKFLNDCNRAGKPIKPAKPVKLSSGSYSNIVAEQRGVIAACDGNKHSVERLFVPVEDAVGAIRTKIAALAAAGRPRFTVSARGADIDLASSDYLLLAQGQNGQVPIAQPDAAALVTWLLEDEFADRAEQAVRERYDTGVETVSNAERAERLASIAERRLAAERIEVAAVRAAWASGDFSLGLRADTNPVAVLNLAN